MALGLVAAAAVHAATAACFLAAGVATTRRRSAGTHGAGAALAAWWLGLAGYLLLQSATDLAAAAGQLGLDAVLATRWVANPLLCLAAGGLTYYILYLLTGRAWLRWPVGLLFAGTLVLFMVSMYVPPPRLATSAVMVGIDEAGRSLLPLVYLLVGLPPILGSAALLAVTRSAEPGSRYRGAMVGYGILAYVGTGLVAYLALPDVFHFVALIGCGLVACTLVLLAYYPPASFRARLGIDAAPEQANLRMKRHSRHVQLQWRCGELV